MNIVIATENNNTILKTISKECYFRLSEEDKVRNILDNTIRKYASSTENFCIDIHPKMLINEMNKNLFNDLAHDVLNLQKIVLKYINNGDLLRYGSLMEWLCLVQEYIYHDKLVRKYKWLYDICRTVKRVLRKDKRWKKVQDLYLDLERKWDNYCERYLNSILGQNDNGELKLNIISSNNTYIDMSDTEIAGIRNTGVFPTLYKKIVKTGGYRSWLAAVRKNEGGSATIIVTYGVLGGKMQVKLTEISEGKNIGKKNATTSYSQAFKMCLSKWKSKRKSMHPDIKALDDIKKKWFPMLAHVYEKAKKGRRKMEYPCWLQIKFDGMRGLARYDPATDSVVLVSREQTTITNMPHIANDLRECYKRFGNSQTLYFDGEFYQHDKKQQYVTGIVKRHYSDDAKNIADRSAIKFNVFDCFFTDQLAMFFEKRRGILEKLLKDGKKDIYKNLVMVSSFSVKSEKEMYDYTKLLVDQGYEGTMLRRTNSMYEPATGISTGRSYHLQKVKLRKNGKAKIVKFIFKPKMHPFGFTIKVLDEVSGRLFDINAIGNAEYKRKVFKSEDQFTNKVINFTFMERTHVGVPREAIIKMTKDGTEYMIDPYSDGILEQNTMEMFSETGRSINPNDYH